MDRMMMQAVDAWCYGWQTAMGASLYAMEATAMVAASQATVARTIAESMGVALAAPVAAGADAAHAVTAASVDAAKAVTAAVTEAPRVTVPEVGLVEPPRSAEPPL